MKISTKGRYGLRILLDVALHQEQGPVALSEIARRQDLSQKYLWQVINPLGKARFLRAIRGRQGGYVLARDPGEITVRDMIEVLEGPDFLVDASACADAGAHSIVCTTREVWAGIEAKIASAMRDVTLRDIVQRHKEREIRGVPNYVI